MPWAFLFLLLAVWDVLAWLRAKAREARLTRELRVTQYHLEVAETRLRQRPVVGARGPRKVCWVPGATSTEIVQNLVDDLPT